MVSDKNDVIIFLKTLLMVKENSVLLTSTGGPQDNQEEPLDICCIYPRELENILAIQGVMFPVIPPDLNPNGFYG